MALTRSMIVVCSLLLVVLLAGCAQKKGAGMDYTYNDGWVVYEYDASMAEVYNSSVHGLWSEFAVIQEKSMEAEGPEITATLNGQPVLVDLTEIAPGKTMAMVKVADAGDKAQGVEVHKAIQRYMPY